MRNFTLVTTHQYGLRSWFCETTVSRCGTHSRISSSSLIGSSLMLMTSGLHENSSCIQIYNPARPQLRMGANGDIIRYPAVLQGIPTYSTVPVCRCSLPPSISLPRFIDDAAAASVTAGNVTELQCKAGWFSEAPGSGSCSRCPTGTYSDASESTG
jgi:hypothetical protein